MTKENGPFSGPEKSRLVKNSLESSLENINFDKEREKSPPRVRATSASEHGSFQAIPKHMLHVVHEKHDRHTPPAEASDDLPGRRSTSRTGRPKIVVVKVGTSSIIADKQEVLALGQVSGVVETCWKLRNQGYHVILVTSGAVGFGRVRLAHNEKPTRLAEKQALAAVGQGRLMRIFDDLFSTLRQPVAQILLTRENLGERTSYINARNTFFELFNMDVIPIVNENDTVALQGIKFGNNDTLAALVASLVGASWLFLLTDVPYLYSNDPRVDPTAEPLYVVEDIDTLQSINGLDTGSEWGTGGMATKLTAAAIASAANVTTAITLTKNPENVLRILAGEPNVGTVILPKSHPIPGRKRWVQLLMPRGRIMVDVGAMSAVLHHKNLFAIGIVGIEGDFGHDCAVSLCDSITGQEVARGIANYSSDELRKIAGKNSREIPEILGYQGPEAAIHRDNMMLVGISRKESGVFSVTDSEIPRASPVLSGARSRSDADFSSGSLLAERSESISAF